jgi:hypothetical protein
MNWKVLNPTRKVRKLQLKVHNVNGALQKMNIGVTLSMRRDRFVGRRQWGVHRLKSPSEQLNAIFVWLVGPAAQLVGEQGTGGGSS